MTGQSAFAQRAQDDYAVAANHYARGNWKQSVDAFNELIQRHPNSTEAVSAKFFLAEVLMQRGKYETAYRSFQVFLQRNANHHYAPRANFRMGEAAYRTGKNEIALRVLEDFVRKNSKHDLTEFALPYLGEMRLKRDEPQLAQRAFETALRMFPASKISNTSRLGLAKALQRQGNDAEAMRFYQFLETQPDDNLYGEAHLQMGIISFSNVDFTAAEKHMGEALRSCKSKSSQDEATYWLARTHIETQDFARAVELLKTIVDAETPDKLNVAILFDGAVAASKIGNDKLALAWLERLRTKFPNHALAGQSMEMSIDILQRQGETNKALVLIRRFKSESRNSANLGPIQARILETEGRAHYAAKRYEKTIESFEQLLEEFVDVKQVDRADRSNWRYLKSLGHLGLGDFANAESELSQIDAMSQTEDLKPLVQLARATARFGSENYTDAIPNYRSYLRLSPDGQEQKRARTELTICLAETSRWDEAAAAFEDLKKYHKNDPIIVSTTKFLAEQAYRENQIEHAERWFTLMADPSNKHDIVARGLSGLAWIKMETKDAKSAYEVFERLLNECPDSKFSSEAAMARAKFLEDEKNFEEAAQTYGLVVRRFGNSKLANVAKLRRAYALHKIGGQLNFEEAKTLLTEYLALPSGNPLTDEATYQLAWIHHDLGQPELCMERFAELVDSEPESKYWPDAAIRVAQNATSNNDFVIAKEVISRLILRHEVPPQVMSRALFLQGQIAAKENNWMSVTISMRDLIEKTNDIELESKARYWLAESLYRQKNYPDGLREFERLMPVVNQLDSNLEPWVSLRTAQCHGYEGDWIQAVEIATTSKQRFPNFEADYEFDFILGRGLEDEGKLTDSRAAYQKVIDSTNGGSTETAAIAQWRIGETYFHQEEYREAIKSYHKVDSLFSYAHWRSAALIQAGKCQEHLKNKLHAIKLYTQLVEGFPQSEFTQDAQIRVARLKREISSASSLNQAKASPKSRR